jgi:hypothetical protein
MVSIVSSHHTSHIIAAKLSIKNEKMMLFNKKKDGNLPI